ncbi:PREDICTED: calmodulin-binding protein 60 A-like isoform X2 [Ipomoea nil]|uniref:calmodulin-binding protein 60 A-like isoform X2 n=1 Tax=Ipomoea nil TaxID=35883 RepID=UPI000900F26E|nr:PREDICTED: calmodulin-binding protein 60 A-like isoform X2 [Ipomoea nil]
MSQKRQPEEDYKSLPDGGLSDDKRRRKIPSLKSVVLEVMNMRKMQTFMEPVLEPLIRRVVKEEVDIALRKYVTSLKRNGGKDAHPYELRSLKLKFLDSISPPVFTGTRIEGEDGSSLRVALVDALTGQVVTTGPESSAKVEIVVLEGDFDSDEGNNWTVEEFRDNVVREREGKKALLNGDAILNLKDGVGLVGDISFTDNSSWTRSRKFRLGARLVDNFDGIKVIEGKTESFVVRDHRGELYKKHHPPSLLDEVWRLEKIGKDGAFHRRLSKERIYTVKDFLTLLSLDPARLRNILGTGMSTKMWEVTVEHARTCVLGKKLYSYYASGSEQKNGVVFNIVAQVLGLFVDCQYIPAEKLSETEKAEARELVISALQHWEEVVCFDNESSLFPNIHSSSAMANSDGTNNALASQKAPMCDYQPSPDNMPSIYSIGGLSGLDPYDLHSIDSMDVRFEQPLRLPGGDTNSFIYDTVDAVTQPFCGDEPLPYFDSDYSLHSSSFEQSDSYLQSAVNSFLGRTAVSPDKAQRRWKMLFSVLRWFSVRRIVARKGGVGVNRKDKAPPYY